MNTTTKTRSQRRMEKKQTLLLLVLILVVSLASFFLGAVVGRRGAERELAQKQLAAEEILVTRSPQEIPEKAPDEKPAAVTEAADEAAAEETKLTFYDNLAKEESVPLGSGINMPEQAVEQKPPAAQPPIDLPDQPIVKKEVTQTVAKLDSPAAESTGDAPLILPKVDPKGDYAVQVGSFSTAGDAGSFKEKLLAKDYPAFVAEADLGAKGLWYRVKIGPYRDADAAKSVQQLIEKKEQIKGFVARQ